MGRRKRMFFKAAQRDKSEKAIIAALRAVGATVWQISGKDIPDLLVGYKGQTFLLESKTPDLEYTDKRNGKTYRRDGALRDGQKEFFASWTGGPAREVFTPEEALAAIGAAPAPSPEESERQRRETAAVVPPPRLAVRKAITREDAERAFPTRKLRKDAKALATPASYPRKP